MQGQLTIFDLQKDNLRPCDYRFQRYIGQKCRFNNDFLPQDVFITDIMPYYTYLEDKGGNQYVGTPTTFYPVE